jgi:hypothetical protein
MQLHTQTDNRPHGAKYSWSQRCDISRLLVRLNAHYCVQRVEVLGIINVSLNKRDTYKVKYVIFAPGKKHLFPDISSTNIDTLVKSLYHCAETSSTEVFWLLSHPLPHLRFNLFISETSATKVEPLYATNTSHRKQETFLYQYPLYWLPLLTKETHNRTLLLDSTLLTHSRHFDYWNQPLNMRVRVCYLDYHEVG